MSTQSLDSDIYDYGFILNSTALHEAAISVLVTTIYGRWRTITGSNQKKFRVSCRLLPELPHMLESCDYVCNVLPGTPHTRGLLSGETLKH